MGRRDRGRDAGPPHRDYRSVLRFGSREIRSGEAFREDRHRSPPEALESKGGKESKGADASGLLALLDSHTKSKARGAPIGLFVLAALAVLLYLSLR